MTDPQGPAAPVSFSSQRPTTSGERCYDIEQNEMTTMDGTPRRPTSAAESIAREIQNGGHRSRGCRIWIVGHSFITWAFKHAQERPYGVHLDLTKYNATIRWLGSRGMCWDELLPCLQRSLVRFGLPQILIIHLGGNDWGAMSGRKFIAMARKDLTSAMALLQSTIICWSDIIPRPAEMNRKIWKRCRAKANRQIGAWLTLFGGRHICHEWSWECGKGLFRPDGVHLSFIGQDLFLNSFQDALEALLR
ncbi:uncharacterized protein LOC115093667 [Rhinatrema bivittatum]|uniref:uncharacterized protein LOC115093667 n=1 Tax=Rhinatrema bivittatum TaxID=194408 RepID=UPI00112DE05D|nr:uncharacterized protein LOC115093667 [Rhinatrema bivittatum]